MKDDKNNLQKRMSTIAKAGANLFSKKGFVETSMEEIAAASKLSKGGMYHYFSSKTEVLYYILDNFMDIVLHDLQKEIDEFDSGIEKVRRIIYRHVELFPKYMPEAKTLLQEVQNLPPKYLKKILLKEREYFRITAGALSDYFGPSVERKHVTAMAFILLGMCNSIYVWYNPPQSPVTPEELSKIIFDIIINGVYGYKNKS